MRWREILLGGVVCVVLARAMGLIAQPAPPPMLPGDWLPEETDGTVWVWGKVDSLTRHGPRGLRFVFWVQGRLTQASPAARTSAVWGSAEFMSLTPNPRPVRVWLTWPLSAERQDPWRVTPGERWVLPLRWRAATASHPGPDGAAGFDTWRWMQTQQLSALATVASEDAAASWRISPAPVGMQRWRQQVRDAIFVVVSQPRLAGLVAALCMGDQNAIDPDDWPLFRTTGVAHLVSISGLHVTLLAAWIAACVQGLWRAAHWRGRAWALVWPAPCVGAWVALGVATLYAVFAGWGLPAQRTVWMLLAMTGLRLAGLRWPAHAVWLALVTLIALFDPLALTQPGFWLSYVAVGLLYGMEPAPKASALRRWFHEALGMQWRISLALGPMSLYFFEGFSLAGLWVNVWAIPWVTLVVTPLSLLGLVYPPLWVLAGWASGWLMAALTWAAQTPWALWEVKAPPLAVVVPATLLAIGVAWPGLVRRRLICAGLLLALAVWR